MLRLVVAQLTRTLGRTVALLVAIAVATASFTVLTGAVETNRLQVRDTVTENFRSSYDLLVRPASSATAREAEQGMVRPNYQSGIFGGITPAQLDAVRSIDAVEVAAPVSNLGYVNVLGSVRVDLRPFLDGEGQQLFRIVPTFTMDRGLTRFVGAPVLVYVSRHPAVLQEVEAEELWAGIEGPEKVYAEKLPGRSEPLPGCVNYRRDQTRVMVKRYPDRIHSFWPAPWGYRDPYADTATAMRCYYLPTTPDSRTLGASDPAHLDAVIPVSLPVLLTAIDPLAEDQISGLGRAVVSGRDLSVSDGPPPPQNQPNGQLTDLPVLASTSIAVDQEVATSVERVDADPAELTEVLAQPQGLVERLGRLPGTPMTRTAPVTAQSTWEDAASGRTAAEQGAAVSVGTYWQVGSSAYGDDGGVLRVRDVANPEDAYLSGGLNEPAPVGSDDVGVRTVIGRSRLPLGERSGQLEVVGRFDPTKVLGDDDLSGLISPTYASPLLPGADAESRTSLRGQALAPSSNVAGYAAQPPALLTTLPAAQFLLDTASYDVATNATETMQTGQLRPDPISVIRVRVAGVTGPDPVSRERLNQAVLAIQARTGLSVDIVAGSSGVPTTVVLPGGDHGRPELRLTEIWARKGLAFEIVAAVDRKSLTLFVLILTVCALMVGNAASAAVRTRRTGLGVLSCLGWGAGRLFGLVLGELAVVGLTAGLFGAGLALAVGRVAGIAVTPHRALLAVPPAVLLAVLAGLAPAVRASRATPMDAVRPLVRPPRRAGRVETITRLGLTGLGRTPGRTALAATSLALGTAALAVLLTVHHVFRGLVVGSLLGDAVALRVRGPDLVALAAIIALGVAAVVDVLYLSVREQAGELAMLHATGWPGSAVVRLIAVQGLGIGVLGSVSGALVGGVAVWALTKTFSVQVLGPLLAAVGVGTVLAVLAALGPALMVRRLPTSTLLSADGG